MTTKLMQLIPYLFVVLIAGIVVMFAAILEYNDDKDDSILIEQSTVFCIAQLDVVDCNDWAVEMVKQHGDVLEDCLTRYEVDGIEARACIIAGVFE